VAIELLKVSRYLLFPAQNSFILSKAIFRLIEEPEWKSKSCVSARERVNELFDWDEVANQLGEFYRELSESHILVIKFSFRLKMFCNSNKSRI
jgi:glycosyltransferase involved in cell wall biosynthesis